MPEAKPPPLDAPLARLPGVGPGRSAQLARLGLHTLRDLLLLAPRRHEDRRQGLPISKLAAGEAAAVSGKVVAMGVKSFRKGTKSIFELILDDGTARLHCRWWNLPFMESYFKVGDQVVAHGRPVSLKPRTMDHPETEVIEAGEEASIHVHRIVPVYPLTEGLAQRVLRGLMWRALASCGGQFADPWAGITGTVVTTPLTPRTRGGVQHEMPLPASADALLMWPSRAEAVRCLHFPDEMFQAELARQRLALDELVALQLELRRRRGRLLANARGLPCAGDNTLIKPFLARLGFTLTGAQTAVLRDIRRDLGSGKPMRRLLQGDVGAGKTAVAACAALMAIEGGFNVALMAPTEILADQHWRNFTAWLEPLGVRVALLTGSRKTEREAWSADRDGQEAAPPADRHAPRPTRHGSLFIGTHALLEPGFAPPNLGLVVIDEQHKFGVTQREALVRKGRFPHLLVMTATPIPRTLGLTLYGDLDSSVIRELPPGRGRIRTFLRGAETLAKVWGFVRGKLAEGRQVYVVYPRVEDEDLRTGTKAVKAGFDSLQRECAPHRVALLHGRLPSDVKERVMADFRANRVQALLTTSVIEVGVDVPNATVMVIENAEQFGLAQLHQLRGRIGRGAHESFCILVADLQAEGAKQRLKVLADTTDGFRIAEADLEWRGPGELLGQAQSGMPSFQFADLRRDLKLVEFARDLAARLPVNP
ncbi:MAG: ATP-dependent DNA helicase RecG [Verrucomicrobia bacterium]|nr:ATP-dependent DNA helicase RecG [Verrucomicrobiota bacterium]